MSKPFSVRTQPWTSFDKQSYFIFTDDFCHEKLLTVKANIKPSRGSVSLKQTVQRAENSFKTGGQIKLWFPIWNSRNGSLYFRSKNNQIKVHYDDGLKSAQFGGFQYFNLYCSYQSQKNFKNAVIKAGGNLLAKNFSFDNRVRVGFTQQGKTDVSTGHKFSYAKNDWSFDDYFTLNWKNYGLARNAIRLAYRKNDNDIFLRAQNNNQRNFNNFNFTSLDTYFTTFIFDYVRKIDDLTKAAVQCELTKKGFHKGSFVVQRQIPSRQIGLKLKLSSDKSIALCYQSVLKNYGKWTVGWQVTDLGNTNKSQYGAQFQINL